MFFRKFHGFQGIVVQVHQLYAPRCGKTHILAWRRCLPHVDVLKGGFFHSSSCHACLGQASVSLGAPRMPTNLLHHGSQNRIQKTSRNMAARKGPRLYKKQSGTQREKKHVLTLTLMLVRRRSACKTSAGSSKILRWLTPLLGPNLDPKTGPKQRPKRRNEFFLWPAPLSFDWSPHLRLTCGPAGNRTTTGSLSASSRTTPYQLLHRDA